MTKATQGLSRRDLLIGAALGSMGAGLIGVPTFGAAQHQHRAETESDDWRFTLPPLPYAPDALEPYIDARTMRIHHSKHHSAYTDKLNAAIDGSDLVGRPIEDLLAGLDSVPSAIRETLRDNGGGYANHSLFWQVMSPAGGGEPTGALADAINSAFGSFTGFRALYSQAAASVFGSGWAWLVADGSALSIHATANQDTPLMAGQTPILGIDVWEHAYYLHYQNRRADYINAWFNVVNWRRVSELYDGAA